MDGRGSFSGLISRIEAGPYELGNPPCISF